MRISATSNVWEIKDVSTLGKLTGDTCFVNLNGNIELACKQPCVLEQGPAPGPEPVASPTSTIKVWNVPPTGAILGMMMTISATTSVWGIMAVSILGKPMVTLAI